MAMNSHAPKHTNWWIWAGAAGAAVFVIAILGYDMGWFGSGGADVIAPATEQTAPISE